MNKRLFKYRPVQTDAQLSFVQEVVTERRLYLAGADHFSDPFDGFSGAPAALRGKRILSFTEHRDRRLLWAYYGGWYRGVMIEFDICITTSPFNEMQKVVYLEDQALLATRLRNGDPFSKSAEFSHEGEWRLVYDGDFTHIQLLDDAIKSITFGPSLHKDFGTELRKICEQRGIEVNEYGWKEGVPVISAPEPR